ncbi:HPP family protein [Sphingomonas sp. ASY06-1R]|jgi:CBS domain-containing membrane protein|uniref:HPP family protein n=1 Tax=Sphingomonas sp. ASY06-1R TaxID=3445771 RepID=UPI003FA1CC22
MAPDRIRSSLPLLAPLLAGSTSRDRVIACLGALLAIGLTALMCHWLLPGANPYLAAPIGASAVLVFALPASPLSQPWPVIGGNVVSGLVGVLAAHLLPRPELAAAVAVGGAILAMSLLRCLHAAGGGTALVTALPAPAVAASGYGFALLPVAINAVLLVAIAMLFHRFSGHSYPHRPAARVAAPAPADFHRDDIDRALADMGDAFDISRDDLDLLLMRAEYHAATRLKA